MFILHKNKVKYIFFSFIFAMIIVLFPWEEVRNYAFVDLEINLKKFDYPQYYFDNDFNFKSLKFYISDEPFWYYLNIFASKMDVSGKTFFSLLAVFCIFIKCLYVLNEKINPFYLLFYINPTTLDFVLSQQRNALCFSIFLIVFHYRAIFKYIVIFLLPLIHTLSFIFILGFFVNYLKEKIYFFCKNRLIINIVLLLFSLILSCFMVYGRYIFSSFTDDSRFGDYEIGVNSFIYIAPWIFYLIWIIFFGKKIDINYVFLIFFLSLYIYLTIFDFYAVRFLAMSIPFLILNVNGIKYKYFFLSLFFIHQLILFLIWMKIW